jgi:DNA-directed RNA polymerase subunit N (RpoN/RPB10)
VVGNKYERYRELRDYYNLPDKQIFGSEIIDIIDYAGNYVKIKPLNLPKPHCRRMIINHVDLIEKKLVYQAIVEQEQKSAI